MTNCYQHPDRPAVEQCEVCRRPLCGSCLWYAETGERLCLEHASEWVKAGKPVVAPQRYASGISSSEAAAAQPVKADIPYRGNSTDVSALVAAVVGLASIASCVGLYWALPLLALFLGLVTFLQSRDAVNPRRTRWLAGVGLLGSALFVVSILIFFGFCFVATLLPVILAGLAGPRGVPTPFPLPTP